MGVSVHAARRGLAHSADCVHCIELKERAYSFDVMHAIGTVAGARAIRVAAEGARACRRQRRARTWALFGDDGVVERQDNVV